ncbi:MAG: FAD-dependent oxidoreductase [Methanobacteriota archaeon]|nr:MAG: FAD-dependent oxidoreductase [Euryarchaeota archaeon]
MEFDVAVVGGGILGTSLAYWLAARYEGTIAVLEREATVARHTSSRNTGVVHRPFYLHPEERKRFARASQTSYPLWKKYAADKGLPWREVGTLKVAMSDHDMAYLEKNAKWAVQNGMDPSEVALLDASQVQRLEPNLRCSGALLARTDTCVDYRAFTEAIRGDAERMGVAFLTGFPVSEIRANSHRQTLRSNGYSPDVQAKFVVNCAGGEAVRLAHTAGVALDYTDLNFRGEYWIVDRGAAALVSRNVYSVPRQSDLPFLDPHWIVRADGRRDIGPNAVPVPSPYDYEGLFEHAKEWPTKIFEPPVGNKVRLAVSGAFLGMAARELLSSLSKGEMMRRVQRFIPRLRERDLVSRGFAGVRASVVNAKGVIEKEAIEVEGAGSFHVLNYNSPGATGAPAYTASVVATLAAEGRLDHLRPAAKAGPWSWDAVAQGMGLAG